ncbi:uncharacterized protein LOC112462378 [Temnothorax curvispinosus]|uniref:Uncharacterized protein LOC112462378 n=1 Tax=Temnothorax curvispinosus TaxID=300111 RepID=A0A6J1QTG2_9HYME|nr:uncharacterized protein LOC112462378 [Temnothorax curvispinosus]
METVTLILKEDSKEKRFEVQKQKLMDKSLYFAALWSADYREYDQTEHTINYPHISSQMLQDFIYWIQHYKIFTSATRYDEKELIRLLNLLDLSVLFAADKLIEDITDKLERHFMLPIYAIKIWLLAQKLNVKVLRDLSLDVCLDRFSELPLDSIYDLSKENFLKLIGNINIRATESYLVDVTREWNNRHHKDFTVPLNIIENKEAKILYGIISCEHNNREQYIHCWDGNDFFELTSFEYPPDIIERCSKTGNSLEGMQITARSMQYDLYLCGGEYGIGSGIFNENVWRYSLISKKWILEADMPVERRHMITVFLKDKLYLVGGVGRHEDALDTIDIYDIYTGVQTYFFIYFPDEDIWRTQDALYSIRLYSAANDVPILTKTMSCYIDVADRDKMVLKTITETCNVEEPILRQTDPLIEVYAYPLIFTK